MVDGTGQMLSSAWSPSTITCGNKPKMCHLAFMEATNVLAAVWESFRFSFSPGGLLCFFYSGLCLNLFELLKFEAPVWLCALLYFVFSDCSIISKYIIKILMWLNVCFLVNESENVMITLCYRASFINCACQRTESSLAHLTVVCISSS